MEIDRQTALLEGLRILELTYGPSGSYAGRLFAESGAQVTKISADVYGFSAFRDTGKRIIQTTDSLLPETIAEQLTGRRWDIVLWDSHMADDLEGRLKKLIQRLADPCLSVRIRFPDGVGATEETALQERGGWTNLTGDPDRHPLHIGGYPAASLVGAHAAAGAMFAWLGRKRTVVEVDAMTVTVSALEGAYSKYKETGEVRRRAGNRHRSLAPMGIFPCRDGFTLIGAPVDEQWELLERWMGDNPKPKWATVEQRQESYHSLETAITNWSKTMDRDSLFHTGQAFRLPFGNVQTIGDVKKCPHLQTRQFWKMGDPSRGAHLPWIVHRSRTGRRGTVPMEKLRILDLTSMWSGPYCTRLFADQGVEVLKVEAPHRPDGIRGTAPFFRELNRNKKSVTLDLRQQADLEKFWELVESCDVLVENFSPRVMENFGLTREALWERQPGLLIVSLSAFGQTGPYRDYVGYGPTLESMAGLASLTGYGDGIPWLPGFSVSDMGAGIHGAFALLGALYSHRQDGRGIAIDLSQYEAAVQLSGDYIMEGTFSTELQKTTGSRCVADLKEFGPVLETEMNGGGRSIAAPWSSSGDPVRLYEPAPELGQHNLFLDDFIKKKDRMQV